MFGLGATELDASSWSSSIVLFGARRLPEIGSGVGKAIKNFKRGHVEQGRDRRDAREGSGQRGEVGLLIQILRPRRSLRERAFP